MFLDHVKYAFPETENLLTVYGGRIAFPIFAFLITEGYIHTSNIEKYVKRLSIFALISQIPFMLFRTLIGEWQMLNIMFTLLLGLIAIAVYDKIEKKYMSLPICIMIIILGEYINVDYGWFGVSLILIFYIFKSNDILMSIVYMSAVTIYLFIKKIFYYNFKMYIIYCIMYLIALLIILLYNKKQGKKIKYFLYIFYPVHMLVLYLCSFIIF